MADGADRVTGPVPPSEVWPAVVEADARFREAVLRIPRGELQATLGWALGDFASRPTALRILGSADPSLTVSVLPALEPFLLVSHSALVECRALVLRLPPAERTACFDRLTARVIADTGSDDEAYRRLAELLRSAGASGALAVLLAAASTSDEAVLREVADDFA
ncbi:hypothetical protein DFJ68_3428 [Terracoccus luteus]|uniref:HEAT repeat protein n=1 Tax=Terracoccus luteus TaxID=53356 RepID=A0A495Y2J0_9MICO|nr:hypothetical protein [Terracoccus luteus]RKT79949.1 hypothetical protein DFJ68_3428 [Terracoccus luteus]